MSTCKARRENDGMCCHRCGFTWDVNDPNPPECKTDKQLRTVAIDNALSQSMKLLTNVSTQAKLLHPGDIQGLIEIAEQVADGNFNNLFTDQARSELDKIRELIK